RSHPGDTMMSLELATLTAVNYWLIAGHFAILLVMFFLSRCRSAAVALLLSAVVHATVGLYLVAHAEPAEEAAQSPAAEVMSIPLPEPPSAGPVEAPRPAPVWAEQLAARSPVLPDSILPQRAVP